MYGALDISTSGLVAQRQRMDVISTNLAKQDVILNSKGEYDPFRRRMAVLAEGDPTSGSPSGVHVNEIMVDQSDLTPKFEPGSPYADENGYVYYPNVDSTVEQVNAMAAARSYEANIAAVEATKSMMSVALELLG